MSFPMMDFGSMGQTSPNTNPGSQMNFFDNVGGNLSGNVSGNVSGNTGSNNAVTNESAIKQIFKNNEITVYSTTNKTLDKTQISCSLYVTNNVNRPLNNVKLNLSVKRHVNCKVLSTSGTYMEPMKSLGIKKVN